MSQDVPIAVAAQGIDRSEAAIFEGLQRRGFRVHLWHDPEAAPATLDRLAAAGIALRPFSVRHRLDRRAAAALGRGLLDAGVLAVYAPINRTLAAALRATRGLPIPVVGYRGTLGHLSRFDPASWLTYLHPRLARIVCVSEAVRRHLARDLRIPEHRLVRIYKGHDPLWYASYGRAPPLPPAPADVLTVGFAGRIRPVKGVRHLLEALRHIPPEEGLRVVLVGAGEEEGVERMLREPGIAARVLRVGHQSNATAWIGACDVLAIPSVAREGLPRVALEAMSQGLPVVASRVGGLPELVAAEVTGLLVPPRDPVALAAALRRLRADAPLRHRMGVAGCERVRRLFHVDHSTAAFEALFRSLLPAAPDAPPASRSAGPRA